jgi:MFS family permease
VQPLVQLIHGFKRITNKSQDQVNYACIMLEGLFNTLGNDIMGMNTIIPLFLADLGASLSLVGGLTTMHSIISAISPLLFGGMVAAVRHKRTLSLTLNGISRGLILLIPILVTIGLKNNAMLIAFFVIMFVYYICQPITGISWNYLLGDCVSPAKRGKLLGTLLGISGIITFLASNIIKAIRANPGLTNMGQYASIFFLGGSMMFCSVLFFIPLKEQSATASSKEERNPKAYLTNLVVSFRNKAFDWAIVTNVFSNISMAVNTFFFLFARNTLHFDTDAVSNLLIVQTLGLMAGGFITGRISARFGIKRMLTMVESLGILVPILGLLALKFPSPFVLVAIAVFLIGFSRSGMIGYQAYILEVVEKERTIYYLVSKSMALLPFSFMSMLIGGFLEVHPTGPVFVFQIIVCLAAIACTMRLKLSVYASAKGKGIKKGESTAE